LSHSAPTPPVLDSALDHPTTETEKAMTSNGTYVSLYDQRVELVAAALTANSKLSEKAAIKLAGHVLYALDHIPEKVRYNGK
jgi:Family of unknown function (DUF6307)